MNIKTITTGIILAMVGSSAFAERGIGTAWQPMSLLGTEMMAEPLPGGDEMAVLIVSRPHMFQAGIFEEIVASVATPHHLAGADAGFPKESNLAVLLKASISGEESEKASRVKIDLSKTTAKLLETHELSLEQFAKLLVACISKTIRANHHVDEQATFPIDWELPKSEERLRKKLPQEIVFKS